MVDGGGGWVLTDGRRKFACGAFCTDPLARQTFDRASRLPQELYAAGHYGVKTGRGFYDWQNKDVVALRRRNAAHLSLACARHPLSARLAAGHALRGVAGPGIPAGPSIRRRSATSSGFRGS